jgi:hypothetical protein
VVDYAERWAELMEKEIAKGRSVFEVAEAASQQADTDGISGFMYGAAVSSLTHFWAYGADLAKWHNRQYMPDTVKADAAAAQGKTVNPAVITIS